MAAEPLTREQILVAATQLQGGRLLQPADITSSSVALNAAPAGVLVDTPANRSGLIGSMMRVSTTTGAPDFSTGASSTSPPPCATERSCDCVTGP